MTSQIVLNKYIGRERPIDLSEDVRLAYELAQGGNTYQALAFYKDVFAARISEDIDTEPLDEEHLKMFIKTGRLLNQSKKDRRRK